MLMLITRKSLQKFLQTFANFSSSCAVLFYFTCASGFTIDRSCNFSAQCDHEGAWLVVCRLQEPRNNNNNNSNNDLYTHGNEPTRRRLSFTRGRVARLQLHVQLFDVVNKLFAVVVSAFRRRRRRVPPSFRRSAAASCFDLTGAAVA